MNTVKLIEILKAAGYDDSVAGIAAFERLDLCAFFEAHRKAVKYEAPSVTDITNAVEAELSDGVWPGEWCLQFQEHVSFFRNVLERLLRNRLAKRKETLDFGRMMLLMSEAPRSSGDDPA